MNIKKQSIVFLFLLFCIKSIAQTKQVATKEETIQLAGGYSLHGSGDYPGIFFTTEYIKLYGKRFALNYNFRGTINNGSSFSYQAISGPLENITDSSRLTTAGLQLGINGQYSIMKTPTNDVFVSIGGFGRYQSDAVQYFRYQNGNIVIPFGSENTPQKTYSVGVLFQFGYKLTFQNRISTGVLIGLQTDTNGDIIRQYGLILGKRF